MGYQSYRRRRWTYSFRAWIDEWGYNADREHWECEAPLRCLGLEVDRDCRHVRLWDLNWCRGSRNIVRIERRRWPPWLRIVVGRGHRTLLRIGRSPYGG